MNRKSKDIASLGMTGTVIAILSWIFVPEDFNFIFENHPMRVKIFLVIIIFTVGLILALAKWLLKKREEMKEKETELGLNIDALNSQLREKENLLVSERGKYEKLIEEEKSKNEKLESTSSDKIEGLKKEANKRENELTAKIKEKELIIDKKDQEKEYYLSQISDLQSRLQNLEKSDVIKYDNLRKEKKEIEHKIKEKESEILQKNNEIANLNEVLKKMTTFDDFRSWRHTVLIIDDSAKVIKDLKKRLEDIPCDIVYLNRLEDYRLAEDFEIVISDIVDCSPGVDAVMTLNVIKKRYPYKFVIAMSGTPAECHGLEVDGSIIEKNTIGIQYVKEIKDRILQCIDILDSPKEHWDQVYYSLLSKYRTRINKIETIKSNYIATLKRLSDISA